MKVLIMLLLGISWVFAMVDINTADKKELVSLSGIGSKKADKIISYRETKCFENINELTKIKGIGNKILAKNSENISASECK